MYFMNAVDNGRLFDIQLVQGPVDRIIVNTATLPVHYIAKHLQNSGAFCNVGNFLYCIFCPCFPHMPQAQENFGLGPHHAAQITEQMKRSG